MTGSLIFYEKLPNEILKSKHNHCLIKFSDNSCLIYNDPRRFGLIDLVTKEKLKEHKMIKNLGPEPFEKDFNAKYLQEKLENKKINIKTAMMNNSIVVGIGNIYINEALFASKISPLRKSCEFSFLELKQLISNIKKILKEAINSGGSTLRDYRNSRGDSGVFQLDLKVYGRNNQKCFNCDHKIRKIVQNGRSSFYCSSCQS
jgi:formamidopyrimidine-DNA glycosylase